MESLTCSDCGAVYTDGKDIALARNMEKDWKEMCKNDEVKPRGIAPCPNVMCKGELILGIVS